jgi:hypothetical protein
MPGDDRISKFVVHSFTNHLLAPHALLQINIDNYFTDSEYRRFAIEIVRQAG